MFTINNCQAEKTTTDLNRRLSLKQLLEFQDELNKVVAPTWDSLRSTDDFRTAIISELGEFLNDHGIAFKWWKYQDPALYAEFDTKVEVIDIVHFYLSIMIMEYRKSVDAYDFSSHTSDEFIDFDYVYVGSDKGNSYSDIGLVGIGNVLDHDAFMERVRELVQNTDDMFFMIDTLDKFISAGEMTCEYASAVYVAKHELNMFRQTAGYKDGTYVKVNDGLEDNQRMEPLITAFMDDSTMTLSSLRQNVSDAFYELA